MPVLSNKVWNFVSCSGELSWKLDKNCSHGLGCCTCVPAHGILGHYFFFAYVKWSNMCNMRKKMTHASLVTLLQLQKKTQGKRQKHSGDEVD